MYIGREMIFITKEVMVEAVQWVDGMSHWSVRDYNIRAGDWLIKDNDGGFDIMKDAEFRER